MIQVRTKKTNNWLSNAGYTREEEGKIYDDLLEDVINNPRWYLDNFEYLSTFRVSWVEYQKTNATKPLRYIKSNNSSL